MLAETRITLCIKLVIRNPAFFAWLNGVCLLSYVFYRLAWSGLMPNYTDNLLSEPWHVDAVIQ